MNNFKPMTDTEVMLGKIAGIYDGETPKAYTRLHLILQKIAENPGNAEFDKTELEAIKILVDDALSRIADLESKTAEITEAEIDEILKF